MRRSWLDMRGSIRRSCVRLPIRTVAQHEALTLGFVRGVTTEAQDKPQSSGSNETLTYQQTLQRGTQAVIWGMPAVSMVALRKGAQRDLGATTNDSRKTAGFIPNADRVGISSYEKADLKANTDGTIDLYFGPKSPTDMESNWIPTGEDFFLIFRLYGPEEALSKREVDSCGR
jgi:hypothetical protein